MTYNYSYKLDLLKKGFETGTFTNILKLKQKSCTSDTNNKYQIITYNKDILSIDLLPKFGIYRSVILNENNKVLCFSPPKSRDYETFKNHYPINNDYIIAEEFVEGTMINVFWDSRIGLSGGWEMSTKKNIGANNKFYDNNKTFREMFLEACKTCKLDLHALNKNYCFSFVLQHPDNRIVVKFKTPQLYLISCYIITESINEDKDTIVLEAKMDSSVKDRFANTTVKFPEKYLFDSYKNLEERFSSENTNYEVVGVIIKNINTGERTKIRNPVYERVRKMKGNHNKLKFLFLTLRQNGKIKEYLEYYPENKSQFHDFKNEIHNFTFTLLNNYKMCYVKKLKPLSEFTLQFRTHMFKLHEMYISSFKHKKQHINKQVVIDYVYNMDIPLLFNTLNFQMTRKILADK